MALVYMYELCPRRVVIIDQFYGYIWRARERGQNEKSKHSKRQKTPGREEPIRQV